MASSANLIDIRMKLSGGKGVISGLTGVRKGTEEVGKATSKTAKISHAATGTTSRLTTAYKELGTHAKLALGLVGAGALFGIEGAVSSTEELSKTTTGLTRNLGFSTKAASEWATVASAREISTSTLSTSFGTLSTKMVEAARKGGSLLTPFHQLGISQEEVAEGAGNFQKGLYLVAEALGKEEGGAKRSAAAKALLGRGSRELIPIFAQGTEGLKEQLHWADEFGSMLSGKTQKGLEDMREAQWKNNAAMQGLSTSITKLVAPAIELGDEQLQEFIGTLNDPKLSDEQKIEKIGRQFEQLGFHLIAVVEQSLPKIAEVGGRLGVALAGAVGHAFLHADLAGKLAIGTYVFSIFGGKELAVAGARTVGGVMGTELGLGLVAGATGAFVAYEIWEHLSKQTQQELIHTAQQDGANFVNYFIREINKGLNESNPLGNLPFGLSVAASQLGEVGNPSATDAEAEAAATGQVTNSEIPAGAGKEHIPPQHSRAERAAAGRRKAKGAAQLLTIPAGRFSGSGGAPIIVHTHIDLDGKQVAESVRRHARKASSFR
jgi:hypothetical protein